MHHLYSQSRRRPRFNRGLQVDLARVLLQQARHLRRSLYRLAACELQRHDALPQALPVGNGRVRLVSPVVESGKLGDVGRAAALRGESERRVDPTYST